LKTGQFVQFSNGLVVRCLVLSKINHSNSGLVQNFDPHCTFKLLVSVSVCVRVEVGANSVSVPQAQFYLGMALKEISEFMFSLFCGDNV
jgi:hypothetical protein